VADISQNVQNLAEPWLRVDNFKQGRVIQFSG